MSLIAGSIPNLINGVSQQPDSIRMPTQAAEVENCYPSVVEFLKRRPATEHVTKVTSGQITNLAFHTINRDASEKYGVIIAGGDLKVFSLLDGSPMTVNFPEGKAYLTSGDPKVDFVFLTLNDYTFILNRNKAVAVLSELTPDRGEEGIVFVKQANYLTKYTIVVDNEYYEYTTSADTGQVISSSYIAWQLGDLLKAALATTFDISVQHSTIWIRKKDGGAFALKATDTRSNTHIVSFKERVNKFSDLPLIAPKGYHLEVVGDASSDLDNYFVKFETINEGTTFDTGTWIETVRQGVKYKLDASTMPHVLVRESDGTFTFRQHTWADRVVGDEGSNPNPTFVGRKLRSIFFFRNRLSFLSEENVIMSQVGEFGNFFKSTVMTEVASDPVDIAASHTKLSTLEHATPFSGDLLFFSSQSQFSLDTGDVLSNLSSSIKPITEFESNVKACPVSSGRSIFFSTDNGAYSGMLEYYSRMTSTYSSSNDVSDIAAHAPKYIKGAAYKLLCSTNDNVLFVLSDGALDTVYVYKYFWNGNDKLQSAWCKWVMPGEVKGISLVDTTGILLMQYDDGVYLEKFHLDPGYKDSLMPFEFKMDRKVSVGASWDGVKSTVPLPYPLSSTQAPILVDAATGRIFEAVAETASILTVEGVNLSGCSLLAGVPFMSRYVFSPLILRESDGQTQAAVLDGRLQVRTMQINYADTGYFEVLVSQLYRETSRYVCSGRILGLGSNLIGTLPITSGTMSFPVLSKNDQVTVEVRSDSPLPFCLVSADWEGFYTRRSRRT